MNSDVYYEPSEDDFINWNEANDYEREGFDDDDEPEDDGQPSFMDEHDSTMTSCGWGTDEDYGYYGDEGDY